MLVTTRGRRSRRQRGETPLEDRQFTGERDPAEVIVVRDEIERALRGLSHVDRTLVVLRYYLGMSTREAAATMAMREGTLKSRLHRAMKSMTAAVAAEAQPTEIPARGRSA